MRELQDRHGHAIENHGVVRYWPEDRQADQIFLWCELIEGSWRFFTVDRHLPIDLSASEVAARGERVDGLSESVHNVLDDRWRRRPHSHPHLSDVCWLAPAEHTSEDEAGDADSHDPGRRPSLRTIFRRG